MTAPFVVRDGGRWFLATVPGSSSTPVALDEVLALVRPTGRGVEHEPVLSQAPEPLSGSLRVAPVWAWVGRVEPAGVAVEGNQGERLVLDDDDLRLLDGLVGPVAVEVLAEQTGIADAAERLARLVVAGRVAIVGEASSEVVAEVAPTVPSEVRSVVSGVGGGVRRRVGGDGRVGVHAVWQEQVGPALSLGMLTACARGWEGGVLNEWFDIGVPSTAEEVLGDLAALRVGGRAVLLLSNYVWSVEFNVEVARRAKALCPGLVVVHGGPSTPKYPGDAERFLGEFGDVADVLVRGEGEVTVCRVLQELGPGLDVGRLGSVAGLTFRDPVSGGVVRTAEPERVADLDSLPSPYLSGEFDHIDPAAWVFAVSIETNRGCPYGCTFCDWGSAILSRIRKFDVDRVLAEFRWAAERGVGGVQICDANFGILARDVELAEGFAEIRRETGHPMGIGFTPPKNTVKHVSRVFDAAMEAGFLVSTAISLQTTDEATLAAVDRSNISTEGYLALAADLRRRGHPLMGDLLLGLPEQTYESYKKDLQFFVDHQIMARTWIVKVLPNSPMNAPDYRARHRIRLDDRGLVSSTASLSADDIERAHQLRRAEILGQRLGIVRHLGYHLQWDHGILVTDLLEHLLDVTTRTPERFPLLTWVFEYFDLHATAPVGWHAFYAEVGELLAQDYGLSPARADVATVLRVQTALMPAPQRRFPSSVELAHDYVAYFRDATATLSTTGRAPAPERPLSAYPPATFTVTGDPLDLCGVGLHFDGDSRDPVFEGDFAIGQRTANELESPLLTRLPVFSGQELPSPADRTVELVSSVASSPS